MQHRTRWKVVLLIVASLPVLACGPAPGTTAGKSEPARVETIQGSDLKRVVLTEKAAERIGLQTVPVHEQPVARKRTLGGEVVSVGSGAVLRVRATPNERLKVDRLQPARVLPLVPRSGPQQTTPIATARAAEPPADATPADKTPWLYYAVDGTAHGLTPGQRVLLELPQVGGEMLRTLVPHAAVLYGLRGESWVYTQTAPLTFVRHRVVVDYIEGDVAVLLEGPPTGTPVVAAGGTELFGTEVNVGK